MFPLLFLFGLLLSGCSIYPQRLRYTNLPPGLKIIVAEQSSVSRHCSKHPGHYDDGTPFPALVDNIRCCYFPARNVMFVSLGQEDCIPHELCHAEGWPAETCDQIHSKLR